MARRFFVSAVLAALFTATASRADIMYLSQTRSVMAQASSGAVMASDSRSAPDFGPFDAEVSVQALNPETGFSGFGRANQMSHLEPLRIFAAGAWFGSRDGQAGLPGGGGRSDFSVAVRVVQPLTYEFDASIDGGSTSIALTDGPGGTVDIRTPGSYSGTLMPGVYLLEGHTMGSAGFPAGSGGFLLELVVPAPSPALGIGAGLALGAAWPRRRRCM